MSKRAHDRYNKGQIKRLEIYGKIIPIDLATVETVGGGRCMMAEIFSKKEINVKEPEK